MWRPIEESNSYNLTKTLCLYKRSTIKLIGRIRRNPLKLLSSILSLADKLIVFGPYHNLRFNVSFVRWHNYYNIPTVKNNTFRQPFIAVFLYSYTANQISYLSFCVSKKILVKNYPHPLKKKKHLANNAKCYLQSTISQLNFIYLPTTL